MLIVPSKSTVPSGFSMRIEAPSIHVSLLVTDLLPGVWILTTGRPVFLITSLYSF